MPDELKSNVTDEMLRDMTRPIGGDTDNRKPLRYDDKIEVSGQLKAVLNQQDANND